MGEASSAPLLLLRGVELLCYSCAASSSSATPALDLVRGGGGRQILLLEDTDEVDMAGAGVDSGGGARVEVNWRREGCSYLARRIHGMQRLTSRRVRLFLWKLTVPDIERIFTLGAIRFYDSVNQTYVK
jgi:hypothetical protein